jgi:hypothetical protein
MKLSQTMEKVFHGGPKREARIEQAGDDGDGVGPGGEDFGGVVAGDAADGDERPFRKSAGSANAFEADWLFRVRFGGGGKDGTDGNVVGGEGVGGEDLLVGVGGNTDERAPAENATGGADGEVSLADVNGAPSGKKGEIGAIVHDERGSTGCKGRGDVPGGAEDLLRGAGLVTILQKSSAGGGEGGGEDGDGDAARVEGGAVGNGIERW